VTALPRATVPPRPVLAPAPAGWRGAWTPARARLWLIAAMTAAWLPLLGVPLRGWLDFSAFYAAGHLALTDALTGLAPVAAFQASHGLPITPFVYPAGLALPYAPLALLPYGVAAALHALLMLALLVVAAVVWARLLGLPRRWAVLGALAWAPAAAAVASGQNTTAALLLVVLTGASLAARRDGRAGALVGLLAYKPQLAAPIVGLLVLRGRGRALVAFALVLAGQYLAGIVATGGDLAWPVGWLASVRAYAEPDLRANGWQAASLPTLGARLELALRIPGLALAGWAAGIGVVVACLPALRRLPPLDAVALAAACGLAVSPHAWVYDGTLLLPALGVIAARSARRGWPWRDRWWLAAAYALALAWPAGGILGLTAMPVLVVAVPFALLERGPFRPRAQAPDASPGATAAPARSPATPAR
jgi:hypothetical protein